MQFSTVVAVVLLSVLLVGTCHDTPEYDFAEPGPCGSKLSSLPFSLPASTDCGWRCKGLLYIHTPAADTPPAAEQHTACPFAAPYPVATIISGFLASAVDYFAYAEHLASWGFAVLQYDFSLLGMVAPGSSGSSGGSSGGRNGITHSDVAEVGFLPHFLSLLQSAASAPSSPLHGKLDLDNMGAAGHSRGAKIAAMHYAGVFPSVKAAFLVDPVDGTTATASQPGYPSAVEALRGHNKMLGVTGAGRIGPCNGAPYATGNWSSFWGVAGAGSWLEVVPDAGHLQFAAISSLLDLLCCRGCRGLVSHKEGIDLAKVPMTAWFHQQLRAGHISNAGSTSNSIITGSSTRHGSTRTHSHSSSTSRKLLDQAGFTSSVEHAGSSKAPESGAAVGATGAHPVALAAGALPGSFEEWVCGEEDAGKIVFRVKGREGDVCESMA